jgi:hypothetical protein
MRVLAAVLGMAMVVRAAPARADEIRPDFAAIEPGQDPRETYRLNAFEIVHQQVSGIFPTIFVGRGNWWRPVRGKFRYPTAYDDFFLKLGRSDLRDRDHDRRLVSSTLFWGGAVVSLGGLALLLSGLATHHDTRTEIGVGVFAGGLVATAVGSAIQPPLVSEEDAVEMARAYNRLLQVHLGLAPVAPGPAADRIPLGLRLSRGW